MRVFVAGLCLALALMVSTTAFAASRFYLVGWVAAPGYPAECAESAEGWNYNYAYANNFAKMNWGGTCNQSNGRPAGWLQITLKQFSGSSLTGFKGPLYNGANGSVASVSQLYSTGSNAACSEAGYWKSSGWWYYSGLNCTYL